MRILGIPLIAIFLLGCGPSKREVELESQLKELQTEIQQLSENVKSTEEARSAAEEKAKEELAIEKAAKNAALETAKAAEVKNAELIEKQKKKHKKELVELLNAADQFFGTVSQEVITKDAFERFIKLKTEDVINEIITHKHKRDLNSFLIRFVNYADFDSTKMFEIKPDDIDDFWTDTFGGKKHRTNYNYLKSFFNWAKERNYIFDIPLPKKWTGSQGDGDINIFSPEQGRILLEGAYEELLPYYIFNGWAGARKAEIARCQWEDFDWANRELVIKKKNSKGKIKKRRCFIEDAPFEWLLPYEGRCGNIWPVNFDKLWDANRKELGLFECWGHNPLRHSYGTYHVAYHRDKNKTITQMGHKDFQMLENNYDEVVGHGESLDWFNIKPNFSAADVLRDSSSERTKRA